MEDHKVLAFALQLEFASFIRRLIMTVIVNIESGIHEQKSGLFV